MKEMNNNIYNNGHLALPELLSPAGNRESLDFALAYGADAVYFGSTRFGMRAGASNFPLEQIEDVVKFVHSKGAKAYLTSNIIPRNDDLENLPDFLEKVAAAGVDALIVADLGVLSLAKKHTPDLDIHISTQLGVTNYMTALYLSEMGVKRIVLSRELSLDEIHEIRSKIPAEVELECFVHGAMCVSFSGRCLISNYMVGRDANRGDCTQPCRWKYNLVEETRPGEYIPVLENVSGTHILSSKDLSMIKHIPELVQAGISSFKIEGRAKNVYYTAVVTNAYRKAMDEWNKKQTLTYKPSQWILDELDKISHREYCTGFYFEPPAKNAQISYKGGYHRQWDLAAIVLGQADGYLTVMQRNKFCNGDRLEILEPGKEPFSIVVDGLQTEDGVSIDSAPHPMMTVKFICEKEVRVNSIIRKQRILA